MKILLLGAGYATRLYPLTKDRPKPLLPVAGRPMLEWILQRVEGVSEVDGGYLVTNDRFFDHYREWLSSFRSRWPIELVNDQSRSEEDKLGAVGDLQWVLREKKVDDDLLVVAGDNLLDLDIRAFVRFYREKEASVIALRDMKGSPLINRYSVVALGDDQRIIDFEEKPARPKSSLIAICLYLFPRSVFPLVSRYIEQGNNPDAPGYFIQWLHRVVPVYGYVFDDLWFDIGDIDSYNEANRVYGTRAKKA
jgi:glucose-1-phosphate thymidylyltransferase